MWLTSAPLCIGRVVRQISRIINGIGVGVLGLMMILTVTDVFLRYSINRPLSSSFELTELMMVVVICFGLAQTGVLKDHISVEMLVSRFSERLQNIINSITSLVSVGVLSLVTWQSFVQAKMLYEDGLTSAVLYIPIFPFHIVAGLGFAVFTLVLLGDFFNSLSEAVKK